MRAIVIGLIFAAIVLAGGTAYLLSSYLSTQEANIAAQAPKVTGIKVMVAGIDLPPGTPLNASNIGWQGWPEDSLNDEFITEQSSEDPIGDLEKEKSVVRNLFVKGDPIIRRKLYSPKNGGFMPGAIKPGMRAVIIAVNKQTSSGGFILPGDRVDVLLGHTLLKQALLNKNPDADLPLMNRVTEIIMEDILVIAVNGNVGPAPSGAPAPAVLEVLLEVTPKQAEKLITARKMGDLSILLRPLESVDSYPKGDGPGYTTDIEVSPTLSSLDAVLEGKSITTTTKSKSAPSTVKPTQPQTAGQPSAKIKVFK